MKKARNHWGAKWAAALLALLLLVAALPLTAFADTSSLPTDTSGATDDTSAGDAAQDETQPAAPAVTTGAGMYEPPFAIEAPAAIVVNEESGIVIYTKDADTPYEAASLVKMMTAIIVMEYVQDLDGTLITMESWVNDALYGKNASVADIRAGETLSVRELLWATVLYSGCEAALVLAGYVGGGSVDTFVQLMNNKATELGCTGTYFDEPTGLSTANITTARDMVTITRAFMQYPTLVEIAGSTTYTMAAHEKHAAEYNLFTTNRLIVHTSPYYQRYAGVANAIKAGKTGSLGVWQNFACVAEQDGMTYYVVVLNSPNEADPIGVENAGVGGYRPALIETGELLRWAYTGFSVRASLDTNQAIHSVPVRYSTQDGEVMLLPDTDLKTILPVDARDSDIDMVWNLPEAVDAPVKQGDVVGSVTLSLNGQLIGTSGLLAAKDVERNSFKYGVEKFKEFFRTGYFRLLLVVLVVAVLLYIGFAVYLNNKKRGRRE